MNRPFPQMPAQHSMIGFVGSDIHAGDQFEANTTSSTNVLGQQSFVVDTFQALSDPLNIGGQIAVQARSLTSGLQRVVAIGDITKKIGGSAGNDSNVPSAGLMALAAGYELLSVAGTITGAYHGYKRNNSVGWAIGWGLLGGLFPFITIPVSLAQGFGKKKGRR